MQGNLRGLLLGSVVLCAIGFSACSDDDEPVEDGTGGTSAGAGGAKGGTSAKAGGAASTLKGGTTGTGGGVVQGGSGGSTTTATGGAVVTGGTGATTTAGGQAGAATTVTTVGGAGVGGAGVGGGTTAATGGAQPMGGAGGVNATGGVQNSAGNAGESGLAGAAGAAGAPGVVVNGWTFDSGAEGWAVRGSGNGFTLIDGTNANTSLTVTGGIATWSVGFSGSTPQESAIQITSASGIDLAGKTVTVRIRWVSGGKGPTATTGQINVNIIPQDADFTPYVQSPMASLNGWGTDPGSLGQAAFKEISYAMPASDTGTGWDPTAIKALVVRVRSNTWSGSDVFDYTTAIFEIESITY